MSPLNDIILPCVLMQRTLKPTGQMSLTPPSVQAASLATPLRSIASEYGLIEILVLVKFAPHLKTLIVMVVCTSGVEMMTDMKIEPMLMNHPH
jgi:hypothetical protein